MGQTSTQTNTEVRETLDRFLRAVESHELERIMGFFNDDAQMFSPLGTFPARLDGRAAIAKQFSSIIEMLKSQVGEPLKLEPQDLEVHEIGAQVALLTFHLRLPGPLHRRSFLMTPGPHGWRIAHIHASVATPA